MAIEAVFQQLLDRFEVARDAFQSLSLTVIEDRPLRDEVLLVDRLGDLVVDLRGWLGEGLAAAADARRAVEHPLDDYTTRSALGRAHEHFIRIKYRFFDEAVSPDMVADLTQFGQRRGGEWLGWSRSVVQALQCCREPLRDVDEAFRRTWQDLSERLGSGSASIFNVNIGHHVGTLSPGPVRNVASS